MSEKNMAFEKQATEVEKNPEQPVSPEQLVERVTPAGSELPVMTTTANLQTQPVSQSAKSPRLLEIEGVLSEGLDQAYMSLSAPKREEFRRQGEATAHKIQTILDSGRLKLSKIRNLILDWLKMIPGLNKVFLEQEAKIKTDRLARLAKKQY